MTLLRSNDVLYAFLIMQRYLQYHKYICNMHLFKLGLILIILIVIGKKAEPPKCGITQPLKLVRFICRSH